MIRPAAALPGIIHSRGSGRNCAAWLRPGSGHEQHLAHAGQAERDQHHARGLAAPAREPGERGHHHDGERMTKR
jgi:hypothetical protein